MVAAIFILWCVIGAVVGYAIGAPRGRASEGIGLGLILGVIGWVIVALLPPADSATSPTAHVHEARRPCPYCAELIQPDAVVCRFCGSQVEPVPKPTVTVESIEARYPAYFDQAKAALDRLPNRPDDELEWLETVCFALRRGWSIQRAVAEATPQAY